MQCGTFAEEMRKEYEMPTLTQIKRLKDVPNKHFNKNKRVNIGYICDNYEKSW